MTTRKRHKQQNKHAKEAIKIVENKEQTDERTEVIINNACNKSSSSSNSSSNISHSNNNCLQQLEQWQQQTYFQHAQTMSNFAVTFKPQLPSGYNMLLLLHFLLLLQLQML